MSFPSGLSITNDGRILQAKAQTGTPLQFTKIKIGDGQLSGQLPGEMTALINFKMDVSLTRISTLLNGKAQLGGSFTNAGLAAGYYFRELGVFANDPDKGEILYCYGNAGDAAEYITADLGTSVLEKHISVIVIVGNAANVSAVIDQSLIFATTQELDALSEQVQGKISSQPNSVTDDHIGNRTADPAAAPTGLTMKLGDWISGMVNRLLAITGESSITAAPATDLKVADQHFKQTNAVHGASPLTNANTIIQRDANGRAKVAAPAADDDIARRDTVTAHSGRTDNPHNVTATQIGAWSPGNDGAGSGLDADLLDGKHWLTVADNYNTVPGSGFYVDTAGGNPGSPPNSRYVFQHIGDLNWGRQVAYDFWNDNIYTRAVRGGTWDAAWVPLNSVGGVGSWERISRAVLPTTSTTGFSMDTVQWQPAAMVVVGGFIYYFLNGTAAIKIEIVTGAFTTLAALPSSTGVHCACVDSNNLDWIYVVIGSGTAGTYSLYRYSISANTFTFIGNFTPSLGSYAAANFGYMSFDKANDRIVGIGRTGSNYYDYMVWINKYTAGVIANRVNQYSRSFESSNGYTRIAMGVTQEVFSATGNAGIVKFPNPWVDDSYVPMFAPSGVIPIAGNCGNNKYILFASYGGMSEHYFGVLECATEKILWVSTSHPMCIAGIDDNYIYGYDIALGQLGTYGATRYANIYRRRIK